MGWNLTFVYSENALTYFAFSGACWMDGSSVFKVNFNPHTHSVWYMGTNNRSTVLSRTMQRFAIVQTFSEHFWILFLFFCFVWSTFWILVLSFHTHTHTVYLSLFLSLPSIYLWFYLHIFCLLFILDSIQSVAFVALYLAKSLSG